MPTLNTNCPGCGYSTTGLPTSTCPECGVTIPNYGPMPPAPPPKLPVRISLAATIGAAVVGLAYVVSLPPVIRFLGFVPATGVMFMEDRSWWILHVIGVAVLMLPVCLGSTRVPLWLALPIGIVMGMSWLVYVLFLLLSVRGGTEILLLVMFPIELGMSIALTRLWLFAKSERSFRRVACFQALVAAWLATGAIPVPLEFFA